MYVFTSDGCRAIKTYSREAIVHHLSLVSLFHFVHGNRFRRLKSRLLIAARQCFFNASSDHYTPQVDANQSCNAPESAVDKKLS